MKEIIDFEKIIEKGESETVEFKKSLSEWKEIIETISAFSNTRGGIILVGVDNKQKIAGISIGKGTIEDLVNKILTNTEPKIYPDIEILNKQNKRIILIKVERYPFDVVLAFGRPFKRVGKNTVRIDKDEHKRRILEINKKELYFDGQHIMEASLEDIDELKLRNFVKKAKEKRKLDIDEKDSIETILQKLKLIKGDTLTNAGILIFGKNPGNYFSQSGIKCIRFKGSDWY